MRPTASPLAVWAGLIVLYLVWGSTYLGMKLAIDTVPPFVMGFLRFVPAGLLLTGGVALRERRTIHRPSAVQVRDASIVGTCLLLGGTGLVAWGQQTIATGIAALLIGLVPMWLAVIGRLLFSDRIPALAAAGIAVGLVGVAILAWPAGDVGSLDPAGLLALTVAPVFWSLGTLYATKRAVLPRPALFSTGLQMIAGGMAFLVAALLTGETTGFDPAAVSTTSWFGIGYLVVVGSLVGFTTYAWLLTVAPLGRIATYAYVNPVVAVILGWLVLDEPITARTAVAAAVIVFAVALIVTARGRGTRTPWREAVPVTAEASGG
ncbi:MAG: EamA family transporter [Chloroflexota bacterium]|nr:EamA family transporter [Chloroflexota bacterium]